MKHTWLTLRREIFIRDLIQDFFKAKIYFDKINRTHAETSSVPFSMLDTWVGTESKKGPLWHLKDQSHRLFRDNKLKNSLYEYLFDWTIGSIFHETMKLKEDSYQVESYKPLLDLEVSEYKYNKALSKIINEYFLLIEKANKNFKKEIKGIDTLFSKALYHLREIFVLYNNNLHVLRLFLDNKRTVEKVFGKQSFDKILKHMFPQKPFSAYVFSADQCLAHGWNADAARYLKKAVRLGAQDKKTKKLIKQLQLIKE